MILVTGGAGFIGSHLVEALLGRGEKVRIFDNLSTGKKENLEEVTGHYLPEIGSSLPSNIRFPMGKSAEFLLGDLTDLSQCRQACQGVTQVFHQAALGSVPRSVEDPIRTHQANVTGTVNILQAAREAGVKRVLYASSSSVYGNPSSNPDEILPKSETLFPRPESPYAVSKLAAEHYCRVFSQVYGLETVSLRYFNVFGPRQDPDSAYAAVIPRFIMALRKGQPPSIYGDGHQSRDFTYVENVVQANLLAMEKLEVSGQVFNIACGERTSISHLLDLLQGISGQKVWAHYEKPRSGEVRHSQADICLAKMYLGYEVLMSLEEGLACTWKWFNASKK